VRIAGEACNVNSFGIIPCYECILLSTSWRMFLLTWRSVVSPFSIYATCPISAEMFRCSIPNSISALEYELIVPVMLKDVSSQGKQIGVPVFVQDRPPPTLATSLCSGRWADLRHWAASLMKD
jgi:hypothetical protein